MAKKIKKAKSHKKKLLNKNTSDLIKKHSVPFVRFMGLSLGGGKSDRTVLTVLDYYLDHKKLVISRVIDRLRSEGEVSADLKLFETIQEFKNHLEILAMDVPLSVPKCFRCDLPCPGFEVCEEPEIVWMWKHFKSDLKINKNHRLFTPYTRRCAEIQWSKELEGSWSIGDALGANQAPLLARGRFLSRRLKANRKLKLIEVLPRLSLLRWSHKQKLLKYIVAETRSSTKGMESREYVLTKLSEELDLFIYDQDKNVFCDSLVAFDSLWAALTAFWKYQNKCELRPKSFPTAEQWIEVPKLTGN